MSGASTPLTAHLGIDWEKQPLLPVIAQDDETHEVLMLAYMNEEALHLTLSSGVAHYFSRSKQRIWKKGEQSGNFQEVKRAWLDCDNDTLLLAVTQMGGGVACHTGAKSCFFRDLSLAPSDEPTLKQPSDVDHASIYGVVDDLYHELLERKHGDPSLSYTTKLLQGGVNNIGKKIVEEAAELSFSIKDREEQAIIYEAADLLYHALVGLVYVGIHPDRIRQELQRRRGVSGIAEKNSRPINLNP